MQRIQDPTAVAVEPAPPALTGTTGFFQGSIGGAIVTRIRYWWLNMIQEELCNLLFAAQLPLDGSATVLQAVQTLINQARTRLSIITTSGQWVCPAGVYIARIRVWGPGGNGGASNGSNPGAGGNGGAYAEAYYPVVPGDSYTVTVGQPGTGVATSFSNFLTAQAGANGGGATGTATGQAASTIAEANSLYETAILLPGTIAANGVYWSNMGGTSVQPVGGASGGSPNGGAAQQFAANTPGALGNFPGGGGSGGGQGGGGTGAAGLCIIEV